MLYLHQGGGPLFILDSRFHYFDKGHDPGSQQNKFIRSVAYHRCENPADGRRENTEHNTSTFPRVTQSGSHLNRAAVRVAAPSYYLFKRRTLYRSTLVALRLSPHSREG